MASVWSNETGSAWAAEERSVVETLPRVNDIVVAAKFFLAEVVKTPYAADRAGRTFSPPAFFGYYSMVNRFGIDSENPLHQHNCAHKTFSLDFRGFDGLCRGEMPKPFSSVNTPYAILDVCGISSQNGSAFPFQPGSVIRRKLPRGFGDG